MQAVPRHEPTGNNRCHRDNFFLGGSRTSDTNRVTREIPFKHRCLSLPLRLPLRLRLPLVDDGQQGNRSGRVEIRLGSWTEFHSRR